MFLPPIYCFYDIDLSHLLLLATDSKANPTTSRNFCCKQVSLGEGGFFRGASPPFCYRILSIFISKSEKNLNEKSKITFELLIEDLLKNRTYTKSLPENGYAKDN